MLMPLKAHNLIPFSPAVRVFFIIKCMQQKMNKLNQISARVPEQVL